MVDKMRVVFINSIFPNPIEPMKGNFILKNISNYPDKVRVTVVAPVPFGLRQRRKPEAANVPFKRSFTTGSRIITVYHPRFVLLPRNLLRSIIPQLEFLFILPLLIWIKATQGIDLLHANFASPDGIACRKLARFLKLPYLITEHQAALDEYLNTAKLSSQMMQAYRDASKVICVSERTRNTIAERDPDLQNLTVIPNGVEMDRFSITPKNDTPRSMIYIGYLVEHKGVHILLEAMKSLRNQGYDLHLGIVGDGAYRKDLESIAQRLSISDYVTFHGEQTPAEIATLLNQHDFLVHPSFIESFGIVVVEALASGLPVVATINGGSEAILNDHCGILVPPRDAHALAQGISQLIDNWATYDPIQIRQYAEAQYSLGEVVKSTVDIYDQILHDRPKTICHLSTVHIRSDVRVFYKQCVGLAEAGYRVHLVVADGKGNEQLMGVKIHDTGITKSRIKRFFLSSLRVMIKALSIPADAYQIHDPEMIPAAILLKILTRAKVVYDIHENYPEMFSHKEYLSPWKRFIISHGFRLFERASLTFFDTAIAATPHIAESFLPRKLPIVHNYPKLSEWSLLHSDQERYQSRNICYLGSITRERGLSQIVRAIESLDCVLHLAGGYEPESYREELAAMPGWAKVKEYGYANRDQARSIFRSCALGVVLFDRSPNHLYSLSTKMFEYMAAGLPILVSDLPANVQLLSDSQCGEFVDPSDVPAISAKLSILLDNPYELEAMGKRGQELVSTKLNWDSELKTYLGIYRSLLS